MAEMSLEARVGRLERENRRLRAGTVAVLAVVVGLVCVAATKPAQKVVRARQFEVVDGKGKKRAVLGGLTDGRVGLSVTDTNSKERVELVMSRDGGAHLGLGDKHSGVVLLWAVDGSSFVALCGAKGESRIGLGLLPDGGSDLAFRDVLGVGRLDTGLLPDGTPTLSLHDRFGSTRASLTVLPNGKVYFSPHDKER